MPAPLTWDSPANLSDADKAAVLAAFQTIKTKLPFLINLTPAERQSIPTLGTTRGGRYNQQQMQDVLNKLDELINAARR